MDKVKLSIIIVNYNCGKYLEECLKSIYEKCTSFPFEIVIFDNNSSDNSIAFLENDFKDVILIKSNENLGFAGGNNKAAEKAKGEYILLLNNDTILLKDINPLFNIFESDPKIGVLGIKMLNTEQKYIPSFGKFPTSTRLLRFTNLNYNTTEFLTGNFNEKTHIQVDWVSGSFLLTKKEIWQQIKGLDEDYFMYVEDVDFCKKVALNGKKTVLAPSLSYIHHVGFNSSREMNLIKGYFLYSSKHFNKFEQIIAKLSLSLNYAIKKAFKNLH